MSGPALPRWGHTAQFIERPPDDASSLIRQIEPATGRIPGHGRGGSQNGDSET